MTATRLVNLYLNRIKAYNGTCVEGAVDAATGLQLGDITPIANAGQLVPYLEPGLLAKNFASALPKSAEPIDQIVAMAFDHDLVPTGARGVNLRMLAAQPRGNEAHYAVNRYFRERGDGKFKGIQDMFAMPQTLRGVPPLNARRVF